MLTRDLTDLLASPPGEASEAEKLDEVFRLCEMARITIDDRACHACLEQLEHYAKCFFAADDDVCWEWHTADQYAKLRGLLLQQLDWFGRRLDFLEIRSRSDQLAKAAQSAPGGLPLSRRNKLRNPAPGEADTPGAQTTPSRPRA